MENPSKKLDSAENRGREIGTNAIEDMPCVFTIGDGPNGKRVEGILYKYGKGEEVRIMCTFISSFGLLTLGRLNLLQLLDNLLQLGLVVRVSTVHLTAKISISIRSSRGAESHNTALKTSFTWPFRNSMQAQETILKPSSYEENEGSKAFSSGISSSKTTP
ncbi:hypothetical protein GH714_028820 [Hevea brasiliensis]|uniref:Ninja-family protein n=1 Tax=Hevea brasiliensis TaxID=3981 RepID=A0A6A6NJT6_HEVBR|nr:hypothetical protein GH714_028820 [Hevea brasiliensis]